MEGIDLQQRGVNLRILSDYKMLRVDQQFCVVRRTAGPDPLNARFTDDDDDGRGDFFFFEEAGTQNWTRLKYFMGPPMYTSLGLF